MSFYDNLDRHGDAVALITENDRSLSYNALEKIVRAFCGHLTGRSLVFILAGNNVASIAGYVGCLRTKLPVALLAADIHSDLLLKLLRNYRPNYLWVPRNRREEFSESSELLSINDYVLLRHSQDTVQIHEYLALLMTTSGSTGSSKFVRLSYDNVIANTESIVQYLELRSADRAITMLPMYYVYGLSVINSHLSVGASIALTDSSLTEKRFWQQATRQQITSFSGVPYTFELLRRLRWTKSDLPHLRFMTQAGGKLSSELVKEFAGQCMQKGILFYVMYGAAEATARMSYLPPSKAVDNSSSIGSPIPGGQFWIQDETGNVVTSANVVGELFYGGPNVFLGYAQSSADLALGNVNGQKLQTGDMAMRDEEGLYYIVGRKTRYIKIFGNRVSLDEIEQLIRQTGVDCACTGTDDRMNVFITDAAQQNEVIRTAHRLTQLHPSAFRAVLVERIPRNESGKILYAHLPSNQ